MLKGISAYLITQTILITIPSMIGKELIWWKTWLPSIIYFTVILVYLLINKKKRR